MKRICRNAASLCGAIAGGLLLFSFLAPWLAVADSFAHFRHYLTTIVALAALVLCFCDWRRAAIGVALAVLGVVGMSPAIPLWSSPRTSDAPPSLTLVQLNLSFRNRTPQAVADFVRRERADIVTFQEVTTRTGRVLELLGKDYPYSISCPTGSRVGGVAVMSRLPRVKGAADGCVEGKGMAWMRVVVGDRPVSVATLHLHWPYPFQQWRQIGELERPLRNVPRPVVLAGDFNAAPWSHAVARIEQASGARIVGGLRFSFYIGWRGWSPSLPVPIDHILLPPGFAATDVRTGPGPGSDHRSIVARLALSRDGETKQARAPTTAIPDSGAN